MAETINDGGAAFARAASEDRTSGDAPDGNRAIEAQAGMSLRDWFAGQAIAGLVVYGDEDCADTAEWAFKLADAMLAARDKVRS